MSTKKPGRLVRAFERWCHCSQSKIELIRRKWTFEKRDSKHTGIVCLECGAKWDSRLAIYTGMVK